MKPVVLSPAARSEFSEAVEWYENQRDGLGLEFQEAVDRVFVSISNNPSIHARVLRQCRRAVLKKFPYCVYYQETSASVLVIAVFHSSRNPTIWQRRVSQ
jgi:toxin ParE1/3/4